MAHEGNKHWLRKLLRGEPHLIIGGEEHPYLRRWYVVPRNRFANLYLHHFLRSDDDRALHDHPWWFASLILKGGYREYRPGKSIRGRKAGSIAVRRPNALHRVELRRPFNGHCSSADFDEIPAWTLVFTGPRVRSWGFACPQGWVQWERFTHQNGCGEI